MEATIGTDEDNVTGPIDAEPEADLLRETKAEIPLAKVADHMQQLRSLLEPKEGSLNIPAIVSGLDQVEYWALAESHFPEEPSVLAEFDTIELMVHKLLVHERSPIALSALMCLKSLLKHSIHSRLFAREATALHALATPMQRFPRKEEIQVEAIFVATIAAQFMLEKVLESDVIACILAAMKNHPQQVDIQKVSCAFFSSCIEMPRKDPTEPPLALLFVQVGAVIDFILKAAMACPTSADLSEAVAHVLRVCSSYPQNHEVLISTSMISVCIKIVERSVNCPRACTEALNALSNMTAFLDNLQKRSIILLLKTLMGKTADTVLLTACCVVTQRLVESEPEEGEKRKEMKVFVSQHLVQLIALALEYFGEDDEQLSVLGNQCLRSLVISKW